MWSLGRWLDRRADAKARAALMLPPMDDPRWMLVAPEDDGDTGRVVFALGPFRLTSWFASYMGDLCCSISIDGIDADGLIRGGWLVHWAAELRARHELPILPPWKERLNAQRDAALAAARRFRASTEPPALPPDAPELDGRLFR